MSTERARSEHKPRRYAGLLPDERRNQRRRRLLAAGLRLFGEAGYHCTSIEDLCAEARVATRHFYELFASREELLAAVFIDVAALAMRAVRRALAAAPLDLEARVRAGVGAFMRVMLEEPGRARIFCIESVGVSRSLEERRREVMRAFARLIRGEARRLAAVGQLERGRTYALEALALVGATHELLVEWLHDPQVTIDQLIETMVRVFLAVARS